MAKEDQQEKETGKWQEVRSEPESNNIIETKGNTISRCRKQ